LKKGRRCMYAIPYIHMQYESSERLMHSPRKASVSKTFLPLRL
jgi:hypothetical protein